MTPIAFTNASLLALDSADPLRGDADLDVLPNASVLVRDGLVASIGVGIEVPADAQVIDCAGRVLMPGLIDCHTHACWAGSRLDEWEQRLAGASYLELLQAGGGIMATVRAVRAAHESELSDLLLARLNAMLAEGTTAVEVKSGYGLDTSSELKMLAAIQSAADRWPGLVFATACIGHAKDPDNPAMVEQTINQTLAAVHAEYPGVAIDAYCEAGAWTLAECIALFERARELGHPIRVHADQFNSLGMVEWAIAHGALSVDHLEASDASVLKKVGGSDTAAVLLPVSGFHVDGRYADGRVLAEAGAIVAVASNCNPGSAPTRSLPLAAALAVRHNGLTPAQAIAGITTNAGWLLRRQASAAGRAGPPTGIAIGQRADLVLLEWSDPRELVHTVGGRAVRAVMAGGKLVHHADAAAARDPR